MMNKIVYNLINTSRIQQMHNSLMYRKTRVELLFTNLITTEP